MASQDKPKKEAGTASGAEAANTAAPKLRGQGTARDVEIISSVIKHWRGELDDVDWEKVAEESGVHGAAAAKERFEQLRRKFHYEKTAQPGDAQNPVLSPTNATGGTQNRAVALIATTQSSTRGKDGTAEPSGTDATSASSGLRATTAHIKNDVTKGPKAGVVEGPRPPGPSTTKITAVSDDEGAESMRNYSSDNSPSSLFDDSEERAQKQPDKGKGKAVAIATQASTPPSEPISRPDEVGEGTGTRSTQENPLDAWLYVSDESEDDTGPDIPQPEKENPDHTSAAVNVVRPQGSRSPALSYRDSSVPAGDVYCNNPSPIPVSPPDHVDPSQFQGEHPTAPSQVGHQDGKLPISAVDNIAHDGGQQVTNETLGDTSPRLRLSSLSSASPPYPRCPKRPALRAEEERCTSLEAGRYRPDGTEVYAEHHNRLERIPGSDVGVGTSPLPVAARRCESLDVDRSHTHSTADQCAGILVASSNAGLVEADAGGPEGVDPGANNDNLHKRLREFGSTFTVGQAGDTTAPRKSAPGQAAGVGGSQVVNPYNEVRRTFRNEAEAVKDDIRALIQRAREGRD